MRFIKFSVEQNETSKPLFEGDRNHMMSGEVSLICCTAQVKIIDFGLAIRENSESQIRQKSAPVQDGGEFNSGQAMDGVFGVR